MTIRLPSRYEDLDEAFRGHLKPNQSLLTAVKTAFQSMRVSGGIRFLPLYGKSGSGKSSAAFELATHLPEVRVFSLPREAIESRHVLVDVIRNETLQFSDRPLIAVVDQYEEVAAQQSLIPKGFVESLALLDRGDLRNNNVLFIWLTTNRSFQSDLVNATTRNHRILVTPNFEVDGPKIDEWPAIIEETFSFHNTGQPLADYLLLDGDLREISKKCATIGNAIEETGRRLASAGASPALQDISKYQVVMLWPVTDGTRISRILQFTDARQGYKLDWASLQRSLNADEQRSVELRELNRARLYFDVRLVPIAAADLQTIWRSTKDKRTLSKTSLERFKSTHFFTIVANKWNPDAYASLRERESQRADNARDWYAKVTTEPTNIHKCIASALSLLGIKSTHESKIKTRNGSVRADVLAEREGGPRSEVVIELKAFAPENTMPSTISDSVRSTLRKHAVLAGFIQR